MSQHLTDKDIENIVELLDQVLITFLSPFWFISSIFFKRPACTKGPFLIDLLTRISSLHKLNYAAKL